MNGANLLNHSMDTEAITNTDSWWKPIDEMRKKITDYNYANGLKTIMGGAWTYDKLVQNARKKGYTDAGCLSVEQLIEIADAN
jgi:hypothetical protein